MIGLFALLIYAVVKFGLKRKTFMLNTVLTVFIIGFFIFQPHIVNYMLRNFKCLDFDGSLRLEDDFEIECWT